MQEEYCTLDPITRKLTLTEPQRIAGVESDEYAKGLKFKFPKTVDDIDLTQMQLRINFMNSRQEKGQHIVTDMKPMEGEEGYITFTWPFSRLVTHYRGYTKLVVCAVKTDESGTITAEWNTALAQMRVLEGLEVDEPDVTPEEKDVISQLISICQNSADEAALSAQQAQEEAEKVLTYGPTIGEDGNWLVGGEDTGQPSQGFSPTVQTKPIDNGTEVIITDKNGEKSFKVKDGKDGEPGAPGKNGTDGKTPNIQIGTVETLPAGSKATASITGDPENPLLSLGIPEGRDGAGIEQWEEIGTIPLSPDVSSYELGEVDEWEKLRLFITRTYNKDLTGGIWLRVGAGTGARAGITIIPGGLATQQYDMSVNNLHQFEVKIIKANNSQIGAQAQSYPIKGPGYGGLNDYPYAAGDKYRLIAATDASLCFDGTETARLFGVRRK